MTLKRWSKRQGIWSTLGAILVAGAIFYTVTYWHPWYTPRPYGPITYWCNIQFFPSDIELYTRQFKRGLRPEWKDPLTSLKWYLDADIQENDRFEFDIKNAQSVEDWGTDLRTHDRLYLIRFRPTEDSQYHIALFRMRQLLGSDPGKPWILAGYLANPAREGYSLPSFPSIENGGS